MQFTEEMVTSLLVTFAQFLVALVLALLLWRNSADRPSFYIILWLIYDAIIHITLEAPFTYISMNGGIQKSEHWLSYVWKEYGKADSRWLVADPTIVSLELLTCTLDSVLCLLLVYGLLYNCAWRHFVQIVLCVCELYGGWMTFCPEWLSGSRHLNTADPFHLWVYLVFFNGLWVVIPLLLLYQSFTEVCSRFNDAPTTHGRSILAKSPYYSPSPAKQGRYNLRRRN